MKREDVIDRWCKHLEERHFPEGVGAMAMTPESGGGRDVLGVLCEIYVEGHLITMMPRLGSSETWQEFRDGREGFTHFLPGLITEDLGITDSGEFDDSLLSPGIRDEVRNLVAGNPEYAFRLTRGRLDLALMSDVGMHHPELARLIREIERTGAWM